MSFVWCIPDMPHKSQQLLCHGYLRRMCTRHIPLDILNLLASFYSSSIYTLKDMLTATNYRKFISPIFEIGNEKYKFKCYLEFWPNGSNEKNIGQCRLFFCFISISPLIEQINTGFTLQIIETDTSYTKKQKLFNKLTTYCSWKSNILSFDEFKDKINAKNKNDTLTISCTINKLEIKQKHKYRNSTLVKLDPFKFNIKNINNALPSKSYKWIISDPAELNEIYSATNVYGIASPIFILFGLKWYLTLCPNGSRITRNGSANIYLHLASVPFIETNVFIKQRLSFCTNIDESILSHNMKSDGWGMDKTVDNKELTKYNQFIINCDIILIDVVSKSDIITEQFINNHKMTAYQPKKVQSFTWNLNVNRLEDIMEDNVDDIDVDESFVESKQFLLFGIKWILMMDNIGKLYLELIERDGFNTWKYMDIFATRCVVVIEELKIKYTLKAIFDCDNLSVNWGKERISLDNLVKHYDECKINLKMEFVDAFFKGKNVNHLFEN